MSKTPAVNTSQEAPIEVGKVAYLWTGEPVFVLAKVVKTVPEPITPAALENMSAAEYFKVMQAPCGPSSQFANQEFADFVVRRYNAGQNGTFYQVEAFSTAELTTKNPNNHRALLDQLFPDEAIEAEASDENPQQKAVDLSIN